MEPIFAFILFPISLFILIKGAGVFLDGASKMGFALGVTPFIVGVFIVGLGTSLPEIAIVVSSVIKGATTIPVASVIGSNIANILLIIGVSALVAGRIMVRRKLIRIELPIVSAVTIFFIFLAYDGLITTLDSIFLLVIFVIYVSYIFLYEDNRTYPREIREVIKDIWNFPKSFLSTILGAIVIYIAAKFTVDSAITLAEFFNISNTIVAVTAIAVGTSLPEFVVSVKAAIRKQSEIAIGSIIGSNVFNLTLVVGIGGIYSNLTLDELTFNIGIPFLLIATFLFFLVSINKRIAILEGLIFIIAYIIFVSKIIGIL